VPRHLGRIRTRAVPDEHVGVVVAAALEFELQHALDERVLAHPDGLEIRARLQRAEPDVEADGEGEEGGDDDEPGVELEEDEVLRAEDGGERDEEGREHEGRVDDAGGERALVEEEVGGCAGEGGGFGDAGAGEERDEEVEAGAEEEGDVEADEDEEGFARHGCWVGRVFVVVAQLMLLLPLLLLLLISPGIVCCLPREMSVESCSTTMNQHVRSEKERVEDSED